MPDTNDIRPSVHDSLRRVTELLHKQEVVESLVHRQQGPRQELVEGLVHRMHLVELRKQLEGMHPADIAYVLEALPLEQRLITWDLINPEREGEILLEVSDAVRETLIAHMDQRQLVAATERLDTDEIVDLAPDLPREVIQDVFRSLAPEEREQLRAAMSYPEGTVGALMDFDMISIRDDVTVEVVLRYLRRLDEMPDHTDQLFVVDRELVLKGTLPLARLIVSDLDREVRGRLRQARQGQLDLDRRALDVEDPRGGDRESLAGLPAVLLEHRAQEVRQGLQVGAGREVGIVESEIQVVGLQIG